jgi:hypothetical protein
MNAFEPLIWIGCAWCIARAISSDDPRYCIYFGFLAGLGLENKYTSAFFLAALGLGVLCTAPSRRFLRQPQLWIGLAMAGLIFLPNFIWMAVHHFPFLELMHNIRQGHRDVFRGPIGFILDQIQFMNPALAPLWIGGLLWLLFASSASKFRLLGIAYVAMLIAFILLRGKNYYLAAFYPILFAAGAVAFERVTEHRAKWTRVVYVGLLVIATVILAPLFSPILPPEQAIAYSERLGIAPPKTENQNTGRLPQYFADEFGWEEMVREVARAFHTLPADLQAKTAIFANSYGQAGAIDFFGPRYGLPKAICNHQNYWLWGPRDYDGDSVIVLGSDGSGDREHFKTVDVIGRADHPYSRRDEVYDIFLCRGLTMDLRQMWPRLKHWN